MNNFLDVLDSTGKDIRRDKLKVIQANMGNLCNQQCLHCHIDAGPDGNNIMPRKTVDSVLNFIFSNPGLILDITGGAAELNPHFDYLVRSARALAKEVIVRSNLTVMFEPGKDYLPDFFKENSVHLICSLPGYTREDVDSQRGKGAFHKSINALRILNNSGYARGNGLQLDLVHNPHGLNLAESQDKLEREYRQALTEEQGISFNRLIRINNVPIKRFKGYLEVNAGYDKYANLLEDSFNSKVVEDLMCRELVSVGWDGLLYDCDFNLALGLGIRDDKGRTISLDEIELEDLEKRQITFGQHCFACAAGAGSSCQGELGLDNRIAQRDNVKYFYRNAAIEPKKELCCPINYDRGDISYIPEEILEVSYGCGSPVTLAGLKQGEVIVDLGCGAGIDCFIAAKKVGVSGRVIGIDMTEEMLSKANRALEQVALNLGFLNCEFRQGFLEAVPVESGSVDSVTSNCVINLSTDKSQVFKEIHRILKPGGRFVISDIVADRQVPVYIQKDQRLWGECISGALTQGEFFSKASEAGFGGLEILKDFQYRQVRGIQFCSITVRGYKFKKGKDCRYIGQYATYLGPYSEVRDEDNHIFARGVAVEICTDTADKLKRPPYAGQFIITEAGKDGDSKSCCSPQEQGKPCC